MVQGYTGGPRARFRRGREARKEGRKGKEGRGKRAPISGKCTSPHSKEKETDAARTERRYSVPLTVTHILFT